MKLTLKKALKLGIRSYHKGKTKSAERIYKAILKSEPDHADTNYHLGLLAARNNDLILAKQSFQRALKANPSKDQFWIGYIDFLTKTEQLEAAKKIIEKGKERKVDQNQLKSMEEKLHSLSKTEIKNTKAPPQKLIDNLIENYQSQRYVEAEDIALALSQKYPQHPIGWKALSALYQQSGKISEALHACKISAQLAPNDSEVYVNMGITLKTLGRLEEAKLTYLKAIELNPKLSAVYNNLGNLLTELGDLLEAEKNLRQAIKLEPNFPEAHNNLGNTLTQQNRFEDAVVCYKQAIGLRHNYAEAINNLGSTLSKMGRTKDAEASFRQSIEADFNYVNAYVNLGSVLKEAGRLEEAEKSCRQAIALQEDHAEVHSNLGGILCELGRKKDAIKIFRKTLELQPENSVAKHMLSSLLGQTTKTAPLDYVETLFDRCADNFENSLINELEYEIPKIIFEVIKDFNKCDFIDSILELGCGTGLFGQIIKPHCNHLVGIDISERMLEKAKTKNVYDTLIKQDIESYLSNSELSYDYFISTDVFIYVGDLFDVFRLIKTRNKKSGFLIFSTEDIEGYDFYLRSSGRYAHSKSYIDFLCEKFSYECLYFDTRNLRKEKDGYIKGGIYILKF